jgi:hypothetical protein
VHRSQSGQSRSTRIAQGFAGAVWIGSWYLMYLEITRWRHVKPTLAFNSDPIPGTDIRPHPGFPLILLYGACAAAPVAVVATSITRYRRRSPSASSG